MMPAGGGRVTRLGDQIRLHNEPRAGSTRFVGRTEELGRLQAGLAAAAAGRGGLYLLTGEAGIGKTRLAGQAEQLATKHGFDVLWGRAWEDEGAPPYWAWIQALRALTDARGEQDVTALLGDDDTRLADLLPELVSQRAARSPRSAAWLVPSQLEAERNRFALFDALTALLRRAAAARPILIVLDDLHSADLPSLLLLQFLARSLVEMPLLVLGTRRESDARIVQYGQEVLVALERTGVRIDLGGWSRSDVGAYVEDVVPAAPARLVEVIHEITRGNPLFVDGFARTVRDHPEVELHDGYPFGLRLPESVRAVIHERLRLLPDDVRAVLAAAAVLGRRFEARPLAEILEAPFEDLVDRLDIAVRAVVLSPSAYTARSYEFAHPLVREALYADIAPGDRLRWHRRIARLFEERFAGSIDEHAGEIAHHYFEGAAEADAGRAVEFACRAAERATDQCAYEEAVHLYRRAIAVVEAVGDGEEARCDLLVRLGEAHLRAGNAGRARQVCGEAAQAARRLGAGELLARAALVFGGIPLGPGIVDPELVGLLEEARRLLGPEPTALRATVTARLAVRLHNLTDHDRRVALCREALDAARLCGSDEALAHALDARHLTFWGQTDLVGQVAVADEITAAGERCGNREILLYGHQLRLADFLEMGDIAGVDQELLAYDGLVGEVRQDFYVFRSRVFHAMRVLVDGEFDRADRLSREAFELGQGIQSIVASVYRSAQALLIERLRGRPGAAESMYRAVLEAYPSVGTLRVGLAALCADFGRRDEAAAAFERVAPENFRAIPRDNNWLAGMALAAEVCVFLGDRHRATALFDLLRPFAGRNAVAGSGAACNGCVSRQLGQLAALLDRPVEAHAFLNDAIERDGRMGARPFVLRSKLDLARLVDSEAGRDAALVTEPDAAAQQLATEVLRGAQAFGMERLGDAAQRLLAARDCTLPRIAVPRAPHGMLRLDGDIWTIAFEGEKVRLKDIRGLHYIARLLESPGTELHCLDLVSDGQRRRAWEAPTGARLDGQAKSAYRERLRELRAELQEAESFHDLARADRARAELDALEVELRRAVGLGGRDRIDGSAIERARVTVAKSIRLALRRIAAHAPALGAHLDATVRTGITCGYVPDPRSQPTWEFSRDNP